MPKSLHALLPRVLAVTCFVSLLAGHAWLSHRVAQLAAMPPADDASIGWDSSSEYTYGSWVVHRHALASSGIHEMGFRLAEGFSLSVRSSAFDTMIPGTEYGGFVMLYGMKPWPQQAFREFSSPSSTVIPPPLRQVGPVSMPMMSSSKSAAVVWPRWALVRLMDALSWGEEDASQISNFTYQWNYRDAPNDRSGMTFSLFDVAPETGMAWNLERTLPAKSVLPPKSPH